MIHYHDDTITLHHGDCVAVLATLPENSIDAIVTDPPYGLEFMGKEWDGSDGFRRSLNANDTGRDNAFGRTSRTSPEYRAGHLFQEWCQQWATECLRVLKPGGHVLAFGGTRTWHRLACAVEDAGFEIRDSIAWLYGSGFPKSLDVSKAIDKAAGAEREVIGAGQYAGRGRRTDNAVYSEATPSDREVITAPATDAAREWQGWGTALKPAFEPIVMARKPIQGTVAANVQQWGTGAINVEGCRIATADNLSGGAYTERATVSDSLNPSGMNVVGAKAHGEYVQPAGRWPANVTLDTDMAAVLDQQSGTSKSTIGKPRGAASGTGWGMTATGAEYDDQGGASRFYFVAKAPTSERPKVDGEAHATVKPLDLMRWLIRLVTPSGGVVLDPFAGSGTTLEAAGLEGFRAVGIEREADYLPLIMQRIRQTPIALFDDGEAS